MSAASSGSLSSRTSAASREVRRYTYGVFVIHLLEQVGGVRGLHLRDEGGLILIVKVSESIGAVG